MRIEVEVDAWEVLDELSDDDLVKELGKRRKGTSAALDKLEPDCLDTALWYWQQGRAEDALYYLEQGLGRNWFGLSEVLGKRAA